MNKVIFKTGILLLFSTLYTYAQEGCTDNHAINFNESATVNDGSCEYKITIDNLTTVTELPADLDENSGLATREDELWVLNDGGNANKLYQIDSTTGQIIKEVIIASALNVDWEDLAESEEHIFIADTGNNFGDRTDLTIYRIPKSGLDNTVVIAEAITYQYEDQVDFTPNGNNNNFDCEALIYYNDSLYLFSKNWVDQQSKLYVVPAIPGNYLAYKRGTYNVGGLVTGAAINTEGTIALSGYDTNGATFLALLFDYQGTDFFSGNKRRLETGTALTNSQTEAVIFTGQNSGYISSERFSILPAQLLAFDIEYWVTPLTSTFNLENTSSIKIFPNPFNEQVEIHFNPAINGRITLKLVNPLGQILWSEERNLFSEEKINVNPPLTLKKGAYFLNISDEKKNTSVHLLKR